MADRLFGVETEYAINGMRGQEAADRALVVHHLLDLAHSTLAHLRDSNPSGVFLENGARLYLDCGLHVEYSTPECAHPWDAVRYIEAGHRTMLELIQKLASGRSADIETCCYRVNVDYSGSGTTWGCHESHLHRMSPEALPFEIIPHLVSRIVYTGAGGFDPSFGGLRFTLSPRASHIEQTISAHSTRERGIFHTKDEPLCGGHHRLHVLCGESLCSQLAMFLKFGATSLVVAMAEAGLCPGKDVQLMAPLEALRTVAGDPTCKKRLRVEGSPGKTAIDIQRHYLAMAEAHVGESFMPPWAPVVCEKWRRVLDLLESGPSTVAKILDWAIKFSLYTSHASRRGLKCYRLPFWAGSVIDPAVRAEFLEIDIRFGQLGPRGVFTMLDDAGVLDHRVSGIDNIEHAMLNPPAGGRAKLRGAVIKRVAGHEDAGWYCDWQRIFSQKYGRVCDLSDPFSQVEAWYDASPW